MHVLITILKILAFHLHSTWVFSLLCCFTRNAWMKLLINSCLSTKQTIQTFYHKVYDQLWIWRAGSL